MVLRAESSPADVFGDASVLFAAAYSPHGSARDLLVAGLRGQITYWVSEFVLDETARNLAIKAPAALPAFNLLRPVLAQHSSRPSRTLVLRVAQVVQPKDAPVVAGAIEAGARYVATYDRRHLLRQAHSIEAAFGVVVATPDEILTTLGLNDGHPGR
jgi:predicted nucleic acid-binding protein